MQNLEWTRMLAWLEAYRGRTTGRRIGLCEAANGIDAGENNVNGVKPHEICILHLSDLHFEKDKHKSVYREMIDDIRKQVEKVRRLVLVVTGDFAMAGRVGEVADKVIVFFEKLKTVIPPECELMDVELVPGNHDIRRPLKKYAFNANTYIGDQGEYLKLEKKIYSLFECTKNRDPESHVSVIEYLGQKIVFARLDTSSLESAKNLKNQVYSDVLGRNETPLLTEDEIKNLSADTKREVDRIIERRKKAFEHEFELQRKSISGQYAEKIESDDQKTELLLAYLLENADLSAQFIMSGIGFDDEQFDKMVGKEFNKVVLDNAPYRLLTKDDYLKYSPLMEELLAATDK